MKKAPALPAILLLVMVLAIWPGIDQPGKTVRDALLLVAGPLALAMAVMRPCRRPPVALLVALAVAAGAGILGAVRAPAPETGSVIRDLLLLGSGWLLALSAAILPPSPSSARSDRCLDRAVGPSLIALGALGIAQAWFAWSGLPQAGPPAATFVNRNVAAQTLVALIPLALAGIVSGADRRARWIAGLASGMGLALLVATRSRGAWLGLFAACAVGLTAFGLAYRHRVLRPSPRQIVGPALLVAVACVLALSVPMHADAKGPVGQAVSSLARPLSGTGEIRLAFWQNGLAMLGASPLTGVGAGRFAVVYPLYQETRVPTPGFGTWLQVAHAHNDPLEFAIELGLPAAVALMFLLVGGAVRSFRQTQCATSPGALAVPAARAAALTGLLIHGLFSFPLHSPASSFLAWFLVGRAWAARDAPLEVLPGQRLVASIGLGLALLGGWVGSREIRAQLALSEALRAHGTGSCEVALLAAERAGRAAPWRRRENGMGAMIRFECDRSARRSLESLEPALRMQSNNLNLLLAVGARRLKAGESVAGADAFRHALRISPRLARAWLGLAMCLDATGRLEEAAAACREALELDPTAPGVRLFCGARGHTG